MGKERQIPLQGLERLRIAVRTHRHHGAIAHLVGVVLIENEEAINGCEGAIKIIVSHVHGLQVGKQFCQDLPLGAVTQMMLAEPDASTEYLIQELLTLPGSEDPTIIERVDQNVFPRCAHANETEIGRASCRERVETP